MAVPISMTVRCPKCRKKHDEPYPNRCGCGQSLVSVLSALRRVNAASHAEASKPAWGPDNAWTLPVRANATGSGAAVPVELTDNEW
jgi:hypothetical protein